MQTGVSTASRWFSYIGLATGILLLLCSIQMFINIQQLLTKNNTRKNGFDFFSITKKISDETILRGEKNVFSENEINELRSKSFIDGVAPLIANEFHVRLNAGGIFSSDLFLESLDDAFIDTVPPSFTWQEGQLNIPIIISSDFLEVYNVFAPGQGLPTISPAGATRVPVGVECSGNGFEQTFRGNIVAFSDRVNSVLVPKSFLEWANKTFGDLKQPGVSRLFIKTKDAANTELINLLDQKNYNVNKEKTKLGRTKQILQGIFTGLGVFGLLVVIMALMLFSFYLQLVVARSRDNLQLLLLLGYSPSWLSKNLSRQFIPVYFFVVLTALLITQLLQWMFHHYVMYDRPELNTAVGWIVIVVAIVLLMLSIFTNYRLVKKLLYKL